MESQERALRFNILKYYVCSAEPIPFGRTQQNTGAVQQSEEVIFERF